MYNEVFLFLWNQMQGLNNGRSTVTDRRNSVCDRRKASLNGHHDQGWF